MKEKNWKKIIFVISLVGILVFSFWYGGDAPGLQGFSVADHKKEMQSKAKEEESVISTQGESANSGDSSIAQNVTQEDEQSVTEQEKEANVFQQIVMNVKLKSKAKNQPKKTQSNKQAQNNANKAVKKESKKDSDKEKAKTEKKKKKANNKKHKNANKEKTEDDKNENKQNEESASDIEGTTENTDVENGIRCTIFISCATVLDNMDRLPAAKKSMIPKDGVILKETTIQVKEGTTVFDALQQVTKDKKIHLEFTYTPVYKSYYIEGIYNLYEFDCGDASGWMYSVNGEFPDGSSSLYDIEDGDVIKWLYSCELGKDVGRYFKE